MPDSKDFEAVKKHITAKYKEKKYAVKHPEKEITGESSKNTQNKKNNKNESSEGESDSESEPEMAKPDIKNHKISSSTSNANKNNILTPVENINAGVKKLTPLNVKNNSNSSNININKPKISNTEGNNNVKVANAAFPNGNNLEMPEQKDFEFFDFIQNNGNNKNSQTVSNISVNNNIIHNANTFNFNQKDISNPQPNNNFSKSSNMNDWGIVWETPNSTQQVKSPNNNNLVNNFEFLDEAFSSQTKIVANNHIKQNHDTKSPPTQNTYSPNMNPFDFNFVGAPISSIPDTNHKTNNLNQGTQPSADMSSLNQNLSTIYSQNQPSQSSSTSQTKKKNYDDLDKYLSDPTLFGPVNQSANYPNSHNSTNSTNTTNQMSGAGNNNVLMMNPQMIQQMQMMMMNPQMQSNPQMMQYMQLMFQNMMNVNMNMSVNAPGMSNNLGVGSSMTIGMGGNIPHQSKADYNFNDFNDPSFNMITLNLNPQTVN